MEKAKKAKNMFIRFLTADVAKICVENPVPGRIHDLPPYSQIIQPYMFGDPWLKRTCLWLKGLPCLMATNIVIPEGKWVETTHHGRDASPGKWERKGKRNPKDRSKTFPGIARAMAAQWGGICDG